MARSYVRGPYAKASCALINELRKQGIVAEVGYGSDPRKRGKKLIANVRAENVFRVPREWSSRMSRAGLAQS